MKNVSSSGRIIQNLSEDEGSLKSLKFCMSSVMRHWLVMGVLGDFSLFVGLQVGADDHNSYFWPGESCAGIVYSARTLWRDL